MSSVAGMDLHTNGREFSCAWFLDPCMTWTGDFCTAMTCIHCS